MTDSPPVDRGPLSGFRVVDLSENMAGPFATMILGDQGAQKRPSCGALAGRFACIVSLSHGQAKHLHQSSMQVRTIERLAQHSLDARPVRLAGRFTLPERCQHNQRERLRIALGS